MTADNLQPQSPQPDFHRWLPWILSLLAVALYANTLGHQYALDDVTIFELNTLIKEGTSSIGKLLSTGYWYGYTGDNGSVYRPLPMVLFALLQSTGTLPFGGHFVNVTLYAGCIWVLYKLLIRLLNSSTPWPAFIATALFAALPIHTEVISNIKSADELLCLLFLLLSAVQFTKTKPGLLLGAAYFFLALLSKETAITYLVVLPLMLGLANPASKRISGQVLGVVLGATVLFFLIRSGVLSKSDFFPTHELINNSLTAGSKGQQFATAIGILLSYLVLVFVPWRLTYDYSFNTIALSNFSDPMVLGSLILHIGLFVLALRLLSKRNVVGLGILAYLAALSINSNLVFLTGAPMAERFAFIPSVGVAMAIGGLLKRIQWSQNVMQTPGVGNVVLLGSFAVIAGYSVVTVARAADWYDNEVLFVKDYPKIPNSSRAANDYGSALVKRHEKEAAAAKKDTNYRAPIIDTALFYMHKSEQILPQYDNALQNLIYVFSKRGQIDSIARVCVRLRRVNPEHPILVQAGPTLINESNKLVIEGRDQYLKKDSIRAMQTLLLAVEMSPENPDAHFNLGGLYFQRADYQNALNEWGKAVAILPNNPDYLRALNAAKERVKQLQLQPAAPNL